MTTSFNVRAMHADESRWRPIGPRPKGGTRAADAACFATVDPHGFLSASATASRSDLVGRQLRRALFLPRLLHRAPGPARPGLRPAHLDGRPLRMRGRAPSVSTASWRSRTITASRVSRSPTAISASAGPWRRRRHRMPSSIGRRSLRDARSRRRDGVSRLPPGVPARLDRRPRSHRTRAAPRREARRLGRDPAVPPWPQDRPARRRRSCGRRGPV